MIRSGGEGSPGLRYEITEISREDMRQESMSFTAYYFRTAASAGSQGL